MNRLIALVAVVLIFFAVSTADAAQQKVTVTVYVVPAYKDFAMEVEGYLKRELRKLKDVTVVEKNGDFFISVVAAPIKNNDQVIGVALSYFFKYKEFSMHNLDVGQLEMLKNMCERVVTVFDSAFLKRYREK